MPSSKSRKSEDDLLLQDFSRNVTTASSVIFYINALLVSAVPIWVFWRIHQMDPKSSAIVFALGVAASTYLVAFAYKNVKFNLKHKIAISRDEGVSKEVTDQLSNSANGKKINKKERDERILWKKNQVADYEATAFSIFYNNVLYILLLVGVSFYILRNFSPRLNYVLSTGVAAGLVALFSTGSQ